MITEDNRMPAAEFYARIRAERAKCLDFARTGQHWFIYKKHKCGPAILVCQCCGEERAA